VKDYLETATFGYDADGLLHLEVHLTRQRLMRAHDLGLFELHPRLAVDPQTLPFSETLFVFLRTNGQKLDFLGQIFDSGDAFIVLFFNPYSLLVELCGEVFGFLAVVEDFHNIACGNGTCRRGSPPLRVKVRAYDKTGCDSGEKYKKNTR
jgi:hypothetical protein